MSAPARHAAASHPEASRLRRYVDWLLKDPPLPEEFEPPALNARSRACSALVLLAGLAVLVIVAVALPDSYRFADAPAALPLVLLVLLMNVDLMTQGRDTSHHAVISFSHLILLGAVAAVGADVGVFLAAAAGRAFFALRLFSRDGISADAAYLAAQSAGAIIIQLFAVSALLAGLHGGMYPEAPLATVFLLAGMMLVAFIATETMMTSLLYATEGDSIRDLWRMSIRTEGGYLQFNVPLLVLGMYATQHSVYAVIALAAPTLLQVHSTRTEQTLAIAETEAITDPLTGLLNRRAFSQRLQTCLPWAPPLHDGHSPADWLLLGDLDNFKRLNDTRGHDTGDLALVRMADQLRNGTRAQDVCARYGGEEFVVIVSRATRLEVQHIAERVRALAERELAEFGTTISVGVHRITAGDTERSAVYHADQAMYRSKIGGKNRITFSDAIEAHPGGQQMAS